MDEILANELEAVPNINVDIGHLVFNLAYPNILMWIIAIVLLIAFFALRLPAVFKPKS